MMKAKYGEYHILERSGHSREPLVIELHLSDWKELDNNGYR